MSNIVQLLDESVALLHSCPFNALEKIETINVWNRDDCCETLLSNYYVFVSDVPFTSQDLNTTLNQAGVSAFLQTDVAGYQSPYEKLEGC